MMRNSKYNHWVLLVGLFVLMGIVACRPITSNNIPDVKENESETVFQTPLVSPTGSTGNQEQESPVPTEKTDTDWDSSPTASPAVTDSAPTGQPSDRVREMAAAIPTPPPNAILPTPAALKVEDMASRGSPDAPITIVEFSDYQCPYCRNYYQETYHQIIQDYVETGQVRYVFKDFPLEQIHGEATKAAEAARCAGEQDRYWEMHNHLFDFQERWAGQADPIGVMVEMAGELELDQDALQSCLESGRYQPAVQENLMEGRELGVTGTPTFFINGYPLVGARSYEIFELALALASAGRLGDAYAQVPTPTPMPVGQIPTGDSPMLGDADAPVLMIEYSDYQCPYCSRYTSETLSLIKENYIDTGKLRYVYKDFPLSFHQLAPLAAEAAHCAGSFGKYWEMHDLLFANQEEWSGNNAPVVFQGYAGALDLDTDAFVSCLETGAFRDVVNAGLEEGLSMGVTGTPAFFVGKEFISGAQPYAVFEQAIERALGQ